MIIAARKAVADTAIARGRFAPVWLVVLAVLLSGCSGVLHRDAEKSARSPDVAATGGNSALRYQAAQSATGMIGAPYRYGGNTPAGFDCSGLVQYSYRSAGVVVPRTSREQYAKARPISLTDAQPGDLLFFSFASKVSHVAIYLGEQSFVHAPSSGKQVAVASLNEPHYRQHFVRVGRIK